MSTSSLDPATSTSGWLASLAIVGSFCLFCENGRGGLPLLTKTSGLNAPAVPTPAHMTPAPQTGTTSNLGLDAPPVGWILAGQPYALAEAEPMKTALRVSWGR